jgi:hypothetical protein
MYVKNIPRELAVTVADDPCILVDGCFLYGHQQSYAGTHKEEANECSRMKPVQ